MTREEYINTLELDNAELRKENKELKRQLEGVREEREYLFNKLSTENKWLSDEKERLKKQLEEYIKQNMKLKDELFVKRKEYQDTYKDVRIEIKEYKTQQKKFIKYLEDEIKQINPKNLDDGELNLRLDDIKYTKYLTYKEILRRYKEIVNGTERN